MSYARPIAAVVIGGLAAHVGFAVSPQWTDLELAELLLAVSTFGLLIVAGLSLGVYGLFAGVEAAVASGRAQLKEDNPTE